MARTVKKRTALTVLGADINGEALTMARMSGAVDGELTPESLDRCDLTLIAIPPLAAVRWIEENADRLAGKTVVDLCGIKRVFAQTVRLSCEKGFAFVGGHPMAGRETSGFASASASLYDGASMILVPNRSADIALLERLRGFFLELGFGAVVFTTAEEHDRIISYTSQLPHIISGAYVRSPVSRTHMGFSAGSFRDMTRVARLDEALWTQIMAENADYLTGEVDALIERLTEYRDALRSGDREALCALLRKGREAREEMG